jgi:hypothetical protein
MSSPIKSSVLNSSEYKPGQSSSLAAPYNSKLSPAHQSYQNPDFIQLLSPTKLWSAKSKKSHLDTFSISSKTSQSKFAPQWFVTTPNSTRKRVRTHLEDASERLRALLGILLMVARRGDYWVIRGGCGEFWWGLGIELEALLLLLCRRKYPLSGGLS